MTPASDLKIVLVPHSVFSTNGKLGGTIQAFDLEGKYLTECHSNNWSSPKEREKAAEEFAEWTHQPIQDCRIAVRAAMAAARKAEREQRDIDENSPRPAPAVHNRPSVGLRCHRAPDPSRRVTVRPYLTIDKPCLTRVV
ncbi:MAG: hypothetical protein IH953_11530 [Chloroflexi bacterium]|nr:hypothetical protein [Chloroflexota bacterium]